MRQQRAGIREQGAGAGDRLAVKGAGASKVVVLPRVWAMGEKKPCGSVRAGGPVSVGSGVKTRAIAVGERNAGISPLRAFGAPVEMTALVGSEAPVKKTASLPSGEKEGVELAFYRKYTEAMLRRYAVMSLEAGRVPSMLGREMFRGKVTSYKVHGFDDVVNFCLDVETCLRRLSKRDQALLTRIALQQYSQSEAALMFGWSLRTCILRYFEAIDRMTQTLLRARLLEPQKCCQEASKPLLRVSEDSRGT